MEMTLRWYGTGYDSVTLEQIRQIPGVRGAITTLYDTLPGEIGTPERIAAMMGGGWPSFQRWRRACTR